MTDWPSTLPQYMQRDDFDISEADNVLAFKPDYGPDILRVLGESNPAPLKGSMKMSGAEFSDLITFYTVTVGRVQPFNLPNPAGGTWSVRFRAPPRRVPDRAIGRWKVFLVFEIMP